MNNNIHKSTLKKIQNQQKVKETLNRFDNDDSLYLHHISYLTGNIRKDSGGIVTEYNGKYGRGYTVDVPYWSLTGKGSGRYHQRYYYILK